MFKARVTMTGKEWKSFVDGIDYLDDNKKYQLTFYAKTIFDWFRFHRSIRRRSKATFIAE